MYGEQKLKQIADQVFNLSSANQTEVLLSVTGNCLTRFANNQIHQNMAWQDMGISIRVVKDKKISVLSTNSFEYANLKKLVNQAIELAKYQKPDPFFISLPNKHEIKNVKNEIYYATEEEMAKGADTIIKKAHKKNLNASGAYANDASELYIANSLGVSAYNASSSCNLSTIVLGEDSSGFASQVAPKPDQIDVSGIADIAVKKAMDGKSPKTIEPGEYEVILEPQAVSEIMAFFQWYGPNARIFHEGASYLSGHMDKQVFGENITIIDDPFYPNLIPMPFDFEGQPKKKMKIIDKGCLVNIAYDSYHASRYNKINTGHALPAPNTLGPIPLHAFIDIGSKTREQMIKNVKKGLLVTRFWYVRVLNPKSLNITGMTRDGTFLIENGEIKYPVKNMRFNQSIPKALNNVVGIEDKLTPIASFEGEMVSLAPTLHIGKWEFSSGTLF